MFVVELVRSVTTECDVTPH